MRKEVKSKRSKERKLLPLAIQKHEAHYALVMGKMILEWMQMVRWIELNKIRKIRSPVKKINN